MLDEIIEYEFDRARDIALAAWLVLPLVVFLLVPVRAGTVLRLAATLTVPIVMFAWATHSPNRSSRKQATLRALVVSQFEF